MKRSTLLEPIRLVVDTPRRVYYRGEEIEGTIRAQYYYGAPLANHEVRYQLADERLHEQRRRQNTADFDDEHHRVFDLVAGVELP